MNKYPENIEDLKTDRLDIIEEIKISIEEINEEVTEISIKNIMSRMVKFLDLNISNELDIWEMIEDSTADEFRAEIVDLHAINLAYAKQNLPSSLR
tara:strand:+ start:379 stop:666 length:288 start_codon:yes stop_codon:yes gene_type:complete